MEDDVKIYKVVKTPSLKDIVESLEDEGLRRCQWRGLYFNTAGKSFRGLLTFDSCAACQRKVNEVTLRMKSIEGFCAQTLDGDVYSYEFSHGFPVPVI